MNIKKRGYRRRSRWGSPRGASGKSSGLLRCMPHHPRSCSTLHGLRLLSDLVVVAVVLVWWMNVVFVFTLAVAEAEIYLFEALSERSSGAETRP